MEPLGDIQKENRLLKEALREVMSWINNWDPEFTDDPEWEETEIKARSALGDYND